jgi:hypothetical protein
MPPSVSSSRLRTLLLTLGTLLFFAALWRSLTPANRVSRTSVSQSEAPSIVRGIARGLVGPSTPRAVSPTGTPTREEVVTFVLATYRKELFTRELELEQRRYGHAYWKSDRSGAVLAQLRADRTTLIAELTAEANDVLAATLPKDRPATITLAPFFDDDHPGPNVGFMSAESRARFEAQVLASGTAAPENLATIATDILAPAELALYHAWNDHANAALRTILIGFDATEAEFLTIRDAHATESANDPAVAAKLEATLGHDRYIQLVQLESPPLQTAVQALNRLGLPLANASWLASTREAATAAIQQVWQDKMLPDAAKADRVALLQRELGQAVATKLGVPGSDLDELGVPQ